MNEIIEIIPNVQGYDKDGKDVGGQIAKVEVNGKTRFSRFGCIYHNVHACPLKEGWRRSLCDARNFQEADGHETPWESPGFTVGCARTGRIKEDPPWNLSEIVPNHILPPLPIAKNLSRL